MQTVTAIINRDALRYNLKRLRWLVPNCKLVAVVKANAYGHGLLETAQILKDVDAFCVARLEEALSLCKVFIKKPILLLEGFYSLEGLLIIESKKIQTIIHSIEQLKILEIAKLNTPIVIWMKLDIGMHRLGIRQEQADMFYQRLMYCKNVKQPVNIVSHFSRADERSCEETEKQLDRFNVFCNGKPGLRSIAASCGILFWPRSHFGLVRPGIILYGISPLRERPWGIDFGFQPVMSLTSILIAIRKHKAGESVSYGETWISKNDTILGVVAIGYGDGYPHSAPSGTPVLVNGREVSIVGRVTMDMVCIDLGPRSQDKIGDPVIMWGDGLPIERVAKVIGVSAYELITRLTSRVSMKYLN